MLEAVLDCAGYQVVLSTLLGQKKHQDDERINIPVITEGFEEMAEARVPRVREKAHIYKTCSES